MNPENKRLAVTTIFAVLALVSLHPVAWGVAGVAFGYTVGKAS